MTDSYPYSVMEVMIFCTTQVFMQACLEKGVENYIEADHDIATFMKECFAIMSWIAFSVRSFQCHCLQYLDHYFDEHKNTPRLINVLS